MLGEFILSGFMGLIAGAVLTWFFFRMRKKKIEKPQTIINSLEKQEREGKVFFVDGKVYDFRSDLAPQKFDNHLQQLREEQAREPYRSIQDLPPLPQPEQREVSVPEKPVQPKETRNSLNKMLGRK